MHICNSYFDGNLPAAIITAYPIPSHSRVSRPTTAQSYGGPPDSELSALSGGYRIRCGLPSRSGQRRHHLCHEPTGMDVWKPRRSNPAKAVR